MAGFPPSFFEDPKAFEPEEVREIEEHEAHDDHSDHEHGEGCGHEAVPHDDHVDYVHDGHRHWFHHDHWDEH